MFSSGFGRFLQDSTVINRQQFHRLSTHEDAKFFHMHKFFGSIAMIHFVYRVYLMLSGTGLGFSSSLYTPFWIGMHALLHVSSFEFILSNRRNKVYNIIWPEMRLHSMIFAYRSLLIMLIVWLVKSGIAGCSIMYSRGLFVIMTMIAADVVTYYYKPQDTSMRGNPYPLYVPDWIIKWQNYFYSVSQVYATLNMMFRGIDAAFLTLIPIQTAPFCMTLVKKGIINQAAWHLYYTLALLTNFYYAMVYNGDEKPQIKLMAVLFVFGRFYLNYNKYVMWMPIVLWHCYMLYSYPGVCQYLID